MSVLEMNYITVNKLDLDPPYTKNELEEMSEDELMNHLYDIIEHKTSKYRKMAIAIYDRKYFY